MNSVWKTALDRIHAEEQLKERTRTYPGAAGLVQQQTRRRTHWRPALASLCLLLMLALGSYWLFLVPTAFISIDLNPSLELSINRFDRVIAVQGYNDEGQAIADSLQLQYPGLPPGAAGSCWTRRRSAPTLSRTPFCR